MTSEFERAIRTAEQRAVTRGMPAEAAVRVRERLDARTRASGPRLAWRIAMPAVLVAGLALGWVFTRRDAPGPREWAGFAVSDQSATARLTPLDGNALRIEDGTLTLVDEVLGVRITNMQPAELARRDGQLEVKRGAMRFAVRRRPAPGPALKVFVSHGAIEVMGTVFTITQGADGGEVALEEGAVRFLAPDGRVEVLAPGQHLSWPLPEVVRPVAPTAPRPPSPVPTPRPTRLEVPAKAALPALLDEVATLKSLGRHEEAVELLEAALTHQRPRETKERLSYELGTILAHHLKDTARACARFSSHLRAWPSGSYAREVQLEVQRLGCPR